MPKSIRIATEVERKHLTLPRFAVVPGADIAAWRLKGTTTVVGDLNGTDIGRRSLKRWDATRWFIDLPERLCDAAQIGSGDRVVLTLRVASSRLPRELADLLATNRAAKACWDRLTVSQQRTIRENVAAAKRPATRTRRATKALT